MFAVAALRGRCQPQAVRGQRVFRDDPGEFARQVMALIEDQQGILVPEGFGLDGGAVIGGDQQRGAVVRPAAEQPHRRIGEGGQQMRIPLVHEVQRRHDDQGALLGGLHGELRQVGLAGARWAARRPPGARRLSQAASAAR